MSIEGVRVVMISVVIVRCDVGMQFCAAAFGIITLFSFHALGVCFLSFQLGPIDLL